MFRYFPSNYVWNLSVDLAIEMGEQLCALAAEDQTRGRMISAGDKYGRTART